MVYGRLTWLNVTMTISHEDVGTPVTPRHGLDSLLIDTATLAHVPYLMRLKVAVMADRYRPAPDEEGFNRWRDVYCNNEYFESQLEDEDTLLLCIGSLREPVGMVVIRRHGDRVEIDDLLVLHPRQGDGTRLITACLRYAEVWRAREVFIDVYPGHLGVEAFLDTHGFERAEDASNSLGRPMNRFRRQLH